MLDALEAHLEAHPADEQAWLVYADALVEHDLAELAAAVQDALRGGRDRRVPALPGTDVAWRMGLWRAASVRDRTALAAVAAHPAARFVEHLVLPLEAVVPQVLVGLPALRRVDLTGGDGAEAGLASLGEGIERLREIRWEGGIRVAPVAPRLVRLVADRVPEWTGAVLPALEQLALGDAEGADLRALARAPLPALTTLRIRPHPGRASAEAELDTLLASPVGRRLRHAELPALPSAAARAHLQGLTVDGNDRADAPPGVRFRQATWAALETDFVRLAPPSSELARDLAFQSAIDDLGARFEPGDRDGEDEAWIAVPPGRGRMIAARMAVVDASPAQHLVVHTGPSGAPRERVMTAAAWEIQPDGRSAQVHLTETGREPTWDVHNDDDEDREAYFYALSELIGGFVRPAVWIPVGWRPDPYDLAAHGAAGGARLQSGDAAVALEPGQWDYLTWRLRWVGGVSPVPAPDLARWTERLLRRHRLDRQPDDDDHPFWADWLDRTRGERARRAPDRDQIASFKLSSGRWLLAADEAAVAARWLRQPIDHHRARLDLGPVLAVLEAGVDVEVRVGLRAGGAIR